MQINLEGKTSMVCGSTQGIGKACAIELAKAGSKICVVARDRSKLETLVEELNALNHLENDYLVVDFASPEQVEQVVSRYLKQGKTIDILVNNTGGPPGGLITEALPSAFLSAFQQHLLCNHILASHCLEGMKANHFGRIINIISTSVKQPLHNLGVSNTIRAAVANWAKTMANETAAYGITVNNVLPGATATGRLKSIITNKANNTGESEIEIENKMLSEIPAGRFGQAEETANAVVFLASEQAAYINGINLPVDGGRTACL